MTRIEKIPTPKISTSKSEDMESLEATYHVKEESTIVTYKNTFVFQGVTHKSYEDMVMAKRKRNEQLLVDSGLLGASAKFREGLSTKKESNLAPSQRGLKRVDTNRKRKDTSHGSLTRRKSSRIAGVEADGMYIADERGGGKFTIGVEKKDGKNLVGVTEVNGYSVIEDKSDDYYRNRINNGDDLTLKQAVTEAGPKWVKDDSVVNAKKFVYDVNQSTRQSRNKIDCVDSSSLHSKISSISVDDDTTVAKVVPERIYAVAFHPSPHKIISVAGDKKGHIGIWDVDAKPLHDDRCEINDAGSKGKVDGVHLFKPHNGSISNLEWNSNGTKLYSVSYDSTVRMFDVQKQSFVQLFGAYDSSPEFKKEPGFGIDTGYKFYTVYGCLDQRNDDSMFLTTSTGSVMHLDFRMNQCITTNVALSDKKINTISQHPNGTTVATCGLDRQVQLWDIRKFSSPQAKAKPFATQISAKSINSAFFSPTGKHLLATNMSDTLDVITDAHLKSELISNPTHRIKHNNKTGRWLTTFRAQWHPTAHEGDELFVVGSMQQPRTMELFNGSKGVLLRGIQGNGLTSVVSRCCFHPSLGSLVVMGGSSSGRVTLAR